MYDFEIIRPASLAEASAALAAGGQALGGGQSLLPAMKMRLADPGRIVALSHLDELKGVSAEGGVLTVRGGTTHAAVAREAARAFPGLAALAHEIGDPAVRNRGTMGGSLANNDPAACYPSAVMATGATIVTTRREMAPDAFFRGMFATALEEGEIVTAVRFPIPKASNYQKFIQPASHFAMVGVFVARFADRVGVGITGASQEGVFRWREAEAALSGTFSPEALAGLAVSPVNLISDIHGSAAYRAHLIGVMTRRAVAAAA